MNALRPEAGRMLLAGMVLALGVEGVLFRSRAAELPSADPAHLLSESEDAPALPARMAGEANAPSTTAAPLPDSLLPERPSLPGLQARALTAPRGAARPAEVRRRPPPARGPPA